MESCPNLKYLELMEDNEDLDNWNNILHISFYLWFYKSCKLVAKPTRSSSYHYHPHFSHQWKSQQTMKGENKKQDEKQFYSLRNILDNGAVIDTVHSK